MVKNEVDIVQDWVQYHASLVGLGNITVMDNGSTDGTLQLLKKLNVHCIHAPDYKKKGDYTTEFIRQFHNELVIPLDMDEFLVYYEKTTNTISCDIVPSILKSLPVAPVYRMNYIEAVCSKESIRATTDFLQGEYKDYGLMGKCFFHSKVFRGTVDHGNHFSIPHYVAVPFVLVHYHNRNKTQIVQKTKDNLQGLGYSLTNTQQLKDAITNHLQGNHHANVWLQMMDDSYIFPISTKGGVSLLPLVKRIVEVTLKQGVVGVVARYNETLEWMLEHPFNQIKYVVYNKGSNQNFCMQNVVEVIQLPNVGRCDHTYLYHVVKQYHSTKDEVTVFLPGSIDIPFKKEKAVKIVQMAITQKKASFIVNEWGNVRNRFQHFTLDEWKCIHPSNAIMNGERSLTPSKIRPFGAWYDAHFGSFQSNFYGIHGIFSVTPAIVRKRQIHEYTNLLKETEVSSNPEVGHYLERAWGAVFKGPFEFL